ncbi:MAG: DUF565 domain-containing protein [Nostocales cyanobacterium 94392]|nr:DUF565 domain-containing protein [Nostocales cyanobacterium 94392]
MQNTRLNSLFDLIVRNLALWFLNPWRRISLLIISFLFGFLMGTVIATTTGQRAVLDVVVAGFLVFLTEVSSRIVYRRPPKQQRLLWVESLNYFKVGFIYNLFIEAFKLGS